MSYVSTDAVNALNKMNPMYKLVADQLARKMLYDFEKKAVASGISKDQAKQFRPSDGQAPIDKMLDLMLMQNAGQFLQHIHIAVTTDKNNVTQIIYGQDQ